MGAFENLRIEKHRLFVDLTIQGDKKGVPLKPAEAYKLSGFTASGTSAVAGAARLMNRPDIRAALEQRRAYVRTRAKISQDDLVGLLYDAAMANVKVTEQIADSQGGYRRTTTMDPLKAIDTLAKLLGLFDANEMIDLLSKYATLTGDVGPLREAVADPGGAAAAAWGMVQGLLARIASLEVSNTDKPN